MGKTLFVAAVVGLGFLTTASGVRSQELEDLKTYCVEDIERLCKGVEPGGGRLLKCLKSHTKEMSVGCAQALQKLKAKK
jgi:hypothetical protein